MALSVTTVTHAATPAGLRRELAALQATIAQSICPRDPEMLREAEAKLVQLTMDINLLEADPRRANLKLRHYPPMVSLAPITHERPAFALAYAWAGVAIMWAFWVSFVIFLAEPRHVLTWWPLPTVDRTASVEHPAVAALIDLALVILFGLQHSVMARAWFKQRVMARMPEPLQRVTYVHTANAALFLLILFWQPIPVEIWNTEASPTREVLWLLFAAGWVVLFLGAWSFGILDLLGIEQVRAWREGRRHAPRLKTGFLYRWLRHPMYVGVLLGVWATPRMSFGHLLLALAITAYVLIAMRYEERDLMQRFGNSYQRWRGAA